VGPAVLIVYALFVARNERLMGSFSALVFAACIALLGPVLYGLTAAIRRRASNPGKQTQEAAFPEDTQPQVVLQTD
jgi:hypothetical protein